jgi:hypothetical protein
LDYGVERGTAEYWISIRVEEATKLSWREIKGVEGRCNDTERQNILAK